MLTTGIILVVLQFLVTFISFCVGNNPLSGNFLEILGYFLVGIIGIILIIVAINRINKQEKNSVKTDKPLTINPNPNHNKNEYNSLETKRLNQDNDSNISQEIRELIIQDINQNGYKMDISLVNKYTRMFRQPFNQVVCEEKFKIKNFDCILYTFSPLYLKDCLIGGFAYMIELKAETTRYFASEYSFNNSFVLCEWKFIGEREIGHYNYGKVVSQIGDILNHKENIKTKLNEILN